MKKQLFYGESFPIYLETIPEEHSSSSRVYSKSLYPEAIKLTFKFLNLIRVLHQCIGSIHMKIFLLLLLLLLPLLLSLKKNIFQ